MEIPQDCDSIYCGECRTRVAFIEDAPVQEFVSLAGFFDRLFNVDNLNIHQSEFGTTLADSCCVQCGTLLGWKLILVTRPDMYILEGKFLMELFDEQNDDQDGDANDQDGGGNQQVPINQQVLNEPDLGSNNEQKFDYVIEQDGGCCNCT